MSTNPDEPARRWTVGRLMSLIAVFALAMALVVPIVRLQTPSPSSYRFRECLNNVRQVGLALQGYEAAHGTLPPAYVADATGRPLYSWRVLILPFADAGSAYDEFHLDEPWDSPHNLRLLDRMPPIYACAAHNHASLPAGHPNIYTSYFALTSPATAFPGAAPTRLGQVRDGLDKTILLVESSQADVPWSAPIDLDPRTGRLTHTTTAGPRGPTSPHPQGLLISTLDNGARVFNPKTIGQLLEPLSTIAGGEVVEIAIQ